MRIKILAGVAVAVLCLPASASALIVEPHEKVVLDCPQQGYDVLTIDKDERFKVRTREGWKPMHRYATERPSWQVTVIKLRRKWAKVTLRFNGTTAVAIHNYAPRRVRYRDQCRGVVVG